MCFIHHAQSFKNVMAQRSVNVLEDADARVWFAARVHQFGHFARMIFRLIDGPPDSYKRTAFTFRKCFALHLAHLDLPDSVHAFMLAQFDHVLQSEADQIIQDAQQVTDANALFEHVVACVEDCAKRATGPARMRLNDDCDLLAVCSVRPNCLDSQMAMHIIGLDGPYRANHNPACRDEIRDMFGLFMYALIAMAWALWSKLALTNPLNPPARVAEMAAGSFIIELYELWKPVRQDYVEPHHGR